MRDVTRFLVLLHQSKPFNHLTCSTTTRKFFSSSNSSRRQDPYATLELTRSASAKEIKDSFYRLSKKYHPDLNPGDKHAEERFKAVSAAYNILADTSKRIQHDRDAPAAAASQNASQGSSNYWASQTSRQGRDAADSQRVDPERMMRDQENAWRKMRSTAKYGSSAGFGFKPPTSGSEGPQPARQRLYPDFSGGRRRSEKWTTLELCYCGILIGLLIYMMAPEGDPNSPDRDDSSGPKWERKFVKWDRHKTLKENEKASAKTGEG